jgi:hypothetical protein
MTATFPRIASAILAIAIGGATASAQSATEQASALFEEGRRLMLDGDFAQACARFEASQQLAPSSATLINLGECRERNHQLATAWHTFEDARRQAEAVRDKDDAHIAATHASRLEPRLSHLTIAVAPGRQTTGLAISLTTGPVDAASWNRALPVDGGRYTITARAPGRVTWSQEVQVANANDAITVDIPLLEPVVAAPGPAAIDRPSRVVPITLGGGALVLAGIAISFEVWARDVYDNANTNKTSPFWHQDMLDDHVNRANRDRYIAEGLGVAAAGCAGLAVYLLVRPRHDHAEPVVAPLASSDMAGLALLGRW